MVFKTASSSRIRFTGKNMLSYREMGQRPFLGWVNKYRYSGSFHLSILFFLSRLPFSIPPLFLVAFYKYRLGASLINKTFCFEISNQLTDSSRRSLSLLWQNSKENSWLLDWGKDLALYLLHPDYLSATSLEPTEEVRVLWWSYVKNPKLGVRSVNFKYLPDALCTYYTSR